MLSKLPLLLERIIYTAFAFLTVIIMILNIKKSAGFDSIAMQTPKYFNFLTAILAICIIIFLFFSRKAVLQILHKINAYYVVIPLLLASIIMQSLVIKYLNVQPSWDFGILVDESKNFIKTGKLANYFVAYPNNAFAECLLSLFGKVFSPNLHAYQILNIAIITTSQFMIYRLGSKVAGKEIGLFGFVLSVFFFPYIFYSPIIYTDTMSLLFLLVPMDIMVGKNNAFRLGALPLIASSVILSFGVLLKGSLIVLIIALAIVVLLQMKKWKRLLFIIPILLFIIVRVLFNSWIFDNHLLDKNEVNRYSFPISNWLLIGQNDQSQGKFDDTDFRYTLINLHKMPRNKLTHLEMEEWKNRIKGRGVLGNMHFFSAKLTNTWADGTYFSLNKLNRYPVIPRNIQSLIDGKSGIVVQGFARVQHFLLMFGVLLFAIFYWKKESGNNGFFTFAMLSLIGFLFFFLMWETRSRYIVSLTPLLIILSAIGYLQPIRIGITWKMLKNKD